MPTRADLDAIEARLTGRDPAAEVAVLLRHLAEAYAVLESLARQYPGDSCSAAVRALLAAHGRPGWRQEVPGA